MTRPPRFAVWLLTRRLPPDDRDDIIGDLEEDFDDRRDRLGDRAARWWYVREAARLAWAVTPRTSQPEHLFPERRRRDAEALWRDLRLAVRRLARQPLVTVLSVVTLASSIGAVTATWSLVDATLLNPVPAVRPDRLAVVGLTYRSGFAAGRPPELAMNVKVARTLLTSDVFASAVMCGSWNVPPGDGAGPYVRVGVTSANPFRLLGVPLTMGRDLGETDDRAGAPAVAIASSRFWHTSLHADPNIVGRPITVNNHAATVVGVAPQAFAGFDLAEPPDVIVPIRTAVGLLEGPGSSSMDSLPLGWRVMGRLRDGEATHVTEARLVALLDPIRNERPWLVPIETAAVAATSRPAMGSFASVLTVAVGLLLAIGCLTVGMLVLIRTEARRDEFAISLALGASRLRLARSVLLEGALLSAAGGLVSLPTAAMFLRVLGTLELPGGVLLDSVSFRLGVNAFAIAATGALVAALMIALIGGVFGFRQSVADALRARSGSTPRLTRRTTRAVLIGGQAAVTLVLASGAALFARSLEAAVHVNPGFETAHLISGSVSLGAYRFTPQLAPAFFKKLSEALHANPMVGSVSLPAEPSGMSAGGVMVVDGVERTFPTYLGEDLIDEHFFSTVGLRILAGRDFTATDDGRAPLVIIVSESFGRLIANGNSPMGHQVRAFHGRAGADFPAMTIVGVVPDVIMSVSHLQPLVMYLPIAQDFGGPVWSRNVMIRPAGDLKRAEEEIASTVRQIDPAMHPVPTVTVMTMDERMARQMGPQRLGATVLGTLGALALILTVLGTYVLAESMAVVRRREMGIRAALGARGFNLGAIVLGETGRLVGLGLLVGLFIVWAEAATIRTFLLRTEPLDPLSLVGTAALILTVTAVVSLRPAIAASRIDIVRVLRDE